MDKRGGLVGWLGHKNDSLRRIGYITPHDTLVLDIVDHAALVRRYDGPRHRGRCA